MRQQSRGEDAFSFEWGMCEILLGHLPGGGPKLSIRKRSSVFRKGLWWRDGLGNKQKVELGLGVKISRKNVHTGKREGL